MKAISLHHLGVPCISKIQETINELYEGQEVFTVNPECLIRYEPHGAVAVPPMLYGAFLHLDEELIDLINQSSFSLKGLSLTTTQLLLDNKVVTLCKSPIEINRNIHVDFPDLPIQVLLDLTSACNCHCNHCYHIDDLDGFQPSLNDIIARIKKLKSLGLGIFEITGGEPLLRNDLSDILDFLHSEGLLYYVVTNGEFIEFADNKLIRSLQNGLGLAVSLDGVGDKHNQIRQRAGLYDKLIRGLDLAYKNHIPIYFVATINDFNIDQVEKMIEIAVKYDTILHLRPTVLTGNAIHNSLDKNDLRPSLQQYFGHKNIRNGLLSTKKIIPESKYYGCGFRKRISIDSRGILYPCVMDRFKILQHIDTYDQKSLFDSLQNETKVFLQNCLTCSKCQLHNGSNENYFCGGFCRFSKSYIKEKLL